RGTEIQALIDGKEIFLVRDEDGEPLRGGAIGLVVDTGSIATQAVHVSPI
ncbi:MAG: hypothetical protein QOG17_3281, partial [Gammaproteobacteria bacterium]|nr:hypothetical protein [Gammaproteobacteria bacterium]